MLSSGLCRIHLGDTRRGLSEICAAHNARVTPDHDVIIEAIQDRAQGYTIFSIVSLGLPRHKRP